MSVYHDTYGPVYPGPYGIPQNVLDLAVELDLAGTWTDISSYAYQREGSSPPVTITRGRPDEKSQATASQCTMEWNNRDGRFSPRNPAGPYYGLLGRNTPVRLSVPNSGTALRLEDDTVSYAATGSATALTGDIDIRFEMDLSGYAAGSLCGQTDWGILLNGDGTLAVWIGGSVQASSTMPVPAGHIAVRVTRVSASGVVTFWTAPVITGAWSQLGEQVTGGGSLSAGSGPFVVGLSILTASVTGRIYEFQAYAGIAGTLKADAQFAAQAAGTTSWTDAQSNTWTVHGTATIDGRSYRGHFECSSLPQLWDPTGTDVRTPVTASGVLRRIQQGNSPLQSVMRRGITSWPSGPSADANSLVSPQSTLAYWPAEDAAGSTQVAAGVAVNSDGEPVQPMSIAGTATFQGQAGSPSADSIFACSAQLGQPGTSTWKGTVPGYSANSTAWAVTFLLAIPSGGLAGTSFILTASMPGGYLSVFYTTASGGTLSLDLGGAGSVTGPTGVNGTPLMVQVSNVGTSADAYLNWLPLGTGVTGSQASGVFGGGGNLTSVTVGPHGDNLGQTEIGHIWVSAGYSTGATTVLPDLHTPSAAVQNLLNGYAGETAASRVARLCAENGIASRIYGPPDTSAAMQPQQIDTLASILQTCEDADRGMLYEPAETLGLGYRTLASMQDQAAAVTLDYAGATLGGDGSAGLTPTDDDQYTVNDVTATRNNGSSVQVQVTTGTLSIQPPPDGVGDYNTSLTVYCQYDAQPGNIAGWVTHVGTTDEERYPAVPLNLARYELGNWFWAVQDVRLGSHIQVTNPPAWLPPGSIDQLVYGTTERLGGYWWLISWNTIPESPFEVAQAGTSHAAPAAASLHSSATSSATSLSVTSASGQLWTTKTSGGTGKQFLVPMYAYPSGAGATFWSDMTAAAETAFLIGNPGSGPGSVVDSNYAAVFQAAAVAGITVLGYVYTSYGARATSSVTADVDAWQALYGITSIMLDEVSPSAGFESYYRNLVSYIKGRRPGGSGTVVLNPGVVPAQGYFSTGADIIIVCEDLYSNWASDAAAAPAWLADYPPSMIATLCKSCSTSGNMATALGLSTTAFNAGYFWATTDTLYAVEPSYLATEKSDVAAVAGTGDFPFSILVSGEQMTVTSASGSSSPQTLGVIRSVNGVVKAQSSGTAVTLADPPVAALAGYVT